MKCRDRLVAIIFALLCTCQHVRSEMWLPLEGFVPECFLIVKAKAVSEGPGQYIRFKIQESWKGAYSPEMFVSGSRTAEGFYVTYKEEHGVHVVLGQEIVFFFTRHNQPETGPIYSHSAAFPIEHGRVVYASTGDSDVRREFKLKDFKKRIIEIQKSDPHYQPPPLGDESRWPWIVGLIASGISLMAIIRIVLRQRRSRNTS